MNFLECSLISSMGLFIIALILCSIRELQMSKNHQHTNNKVPVGLRKYRTEQEFYELERKIKYP